MSPLASTRIVLVAALIALAAAAPAARAGEPVLYDTVKPLPAGASPESLAKKEGWEKAGGAAIRGDGWIENAAIAAWLRKADGRLVLFYKQGDAWREAARAAVGASDEDAAASFASVAPGAGDGVSLTAQGTTSSGKPAVLRCRVAGDRPIVECVPGPGSARLLLDVRAAHALLPDVFGDDIVLRASEAGASAPRLPGEYALVLPLDQGGALLTCVWAPAQKEVALRARDGAFDRVVLPCAESTPLWLVVPAAPGIWHETDAAQFTAFEHKKMDWAPPFPARYRCDLRKAGPWRLTDSWRRETTTKRVWLAFLNYCFPPLTTAADGAYLRIPKFRASGSFARNQAKEITYEGPILVYPFARETRSPRTPDGAWTVLDAVAAALGGEWLQALDVGEGVLEDSPYPKGFVYIATCGATGEVEKIFQRGKEKEQADTIRRQFDGMRQFVRYNRARLDEYNAFAAALVKRLKEQAEAAPADGEMRKAVADLEPLLQYIPDQFEENRETIKTPEHCEGLAAQIVALVDSTAEGKTEVVKGLGKAIRTIGGAQDDMLAAFRMALKVARQRAAQLHVASADPAVRGLMRDVRARTQTILRVRSPYEGH